MTYPITPLTINTASGPVVVDEATTEQLREMCDIMDLPDTDYAMRGRIYDWVAARWPALGRGPLRHPLVHGTPGEPAEGPTEPGKGT